MLEKNHALDVACLQLNTGVNVESNLKTIEDLVQKACEQGATFLFLPEHAPFVFNQDLAAFKETILLWETKVLSFFQHLAQKKNVWFNFAMATENKKTHKLLNRSYLIDNLGRIVLTYDKMHLFNAVIQEQEVHQESKIYEPGKSSATVTTPWGKLGLAICYDVRFPLQFRQMRKEGVDFFSVPSAFTAMTGKAHWHTLLRARAIENACYVIAPNQWGDLPGGLKTYGHSLIISPWGEVLAELKEGVGFTSARIERKEIDKARSLIGASAHDD